MLKNKNIISQEINFAEWYTSVIKEAKLVEYGSIKGTLFFLPNGWAIWQLIQNELNKQFAKIGIKNVQMPLFIRQTDFAKEKQHIQGFLPETFNINNENEKIIIRPTSEIVFCQCFKQILNSYNDLPILFNQWCSVYRKEKNTRPFLRNTEFYWQEIHTLHSTEKEALEQTQKILNIYKNFLEKFLCIPFLCGQKTENEKFAGADKTFTLEALMQDGQMLQCATSHYLNQNFTKAYEIKYQNKNNQLSYAYQTSAGISTRIIGGIIMTHGDNNGLVLPFKIAPIQIAIITNDFLEKKSNIFLKKITKILKKKYRINVDNSNKSFGYKINKFQIQGVPICLLIGSKEIETNSITIVRRDKEEKIKIQAKTISKILTKIVAEYQNNLFTKANNHLNNAIIFVENLNDFKKVIISKKIALAYFNDSKENEQKIQKLTGATARCIKAINNTNKKCFFTNEQATHLIYFARSY